MHAAVLGANDGLVPNVSLLMGTAGAAASNLAVLLAGVTGLVAGACSMALGEWLSVNSSREFYRAQITERAERLAVAPEDGVSHIAGIYREKGLGRAEAEHLTETPRAALDTVCARISAPYPFPHRDTAMLGSVVATAVALALIGTGISLFTRRGMLRSIARQFAITVAAVTWGVGQLLGAAITG